MKPRSSLFTTLAALALWGAISFDRAVAQETEFTGEAPRKNPAFVETSGFYYFIPEYYCSTSTVKVSLIQPMKKPIRKMFHGNKNYGLMSEFIPLGYFEKGSQIVFQISGLHEKTGPTTTFSNQPGICNVKKLPSGKGFVFICDDGLGVSGFECFEGDPNDLWFRVQKYDSPPV